MKRFVVGVMVVVGCVGAVPTVAQASTGSIKGFVCQTGEMPAQRAMSITAVMRPVPDTAKLTMRFQLLRRTHRHGVSTTVSGPGLKSWLTPKDPTLGTRPGDTWIVKHPVVELAAPAYYRFKVTFRWLGSSGQVLAQTSHRSKLCFEPQLEPDLKMVKGWAVAGSPGQYGAAIRNVGASLSSSFTVEVSDPEKTSPLATSQVQRPLAANTPANKPWLVSLSGAACIPGDPLNVTVIPGSEDDSNMADDTYQTTCPQPTPASTALKRKHRTAPVQGVRGR
jgi:hypothetical protein